MTETLQPTWRDLVVAVIGAVLGILAPTTQPPSPLTPPAPVGGDCGDVSRYDGHTYPVSRVLDGDTLDILAVDRDRPTTRVRLLGIDAPEIPHRNKPGMPFGGDAATWARDHLAGHSVTLRVIPARTRGVFGRLLAYVAIEPAGDDFGTEILQAGLAWTDPRWPHSKLAEYQQLEDRARKGKTGLWASFPVAALPKWKRQQLEN